VLLVYKAFLERP